ncbi:unnamed protein product [Amoebophrya sp. A25]|nr:unnamed protein product [Amoebophrya sp. A25]|eukprot:GSA25T00011774001.1
MTVTLLGLSILLWTNLCTVPDEGVYAVIVPQGGRTEEDGVDHQGDGPFVRSFASGLRPPLAPLPTKDRFAGYYAFPGTTSGLRDDISVAEEIADEQQRKNCLGVEKLNIYG